VLGVRRHPLRHRRQPDGRLERLCAAALGPSLAGYGVAGAAAARDHLGPDEHGWVGFDTNHAHEAWAADDDQPGYVPDWWLRDPVDPNPEATTWALTQMRQLRAQLAASMPRYRMWTLPLLRDRVETWAVLVAFGSAPSASQLRACGSCSLRPRRSRR
jgi:hypothetical protein